MSTFFNGTTTGYPLPNLHETYYPFTDFQDKILNTDRGVNGYAPEMLNGYAPEYATVHIFKLLVLNYFIKFFFFNRSKPFI